MKPRAAGLIRQARRSGRIVVGVALTRTAVRSGRVAAVLVAEDLRPDRRDSLIERWGAAGFPIFRGWSKDELGEIAGKPAVSVLAVTDRNIAAGLVHLAGESSTGEVTVREGGDRRVRLSPEQEEVDRA
ncbi:MAG TPA: ribosomal L7Ae/L30e/S12e/Gadd45 family protein [Gemmatimonadota bacterium]|nr:ribosomal L7Ae/L30e/S12e/Gadd45 family protein [Gemmatimonadota bacterium]